MTRRMISALLMISGVGLVCQADRSGADPPERLHGLVWFQRASGFSAGDDRVGGQIDADVRVSDILLLGSIGATVPIGVDVMFKDPSGFLVGGELSLMRIGIEVNIIYLPEAATGQANVRVCGGLLSEAQCSLLRQGNLLMPGVTVPDFLLAEETLGNLGITLGGNYHFLSSGRWDAWAGPMIAWSVWDQYDVSEVRVDLSTSVESLLQGKVDRFDVSNYSRLSPQNALTFGMNAGGRCEFAGRWNLLGQFRYFAGDDVDLPGGNGHYSVAGFSAGIAYRLGG